MLAVCRSRLACSLAMLSSRSTMWMSSIFATRMHRMLWCARATILSLQCSGKCVQRERERTLSRLNYIYISIPSPSGGSTWRPHVTPTGNLPQANSPYLQTVTKTSLAHQQPDSQHIGCGYNNSARPFVSLPLPPVPPKATFIRSVCQASFIKFINLAT